MTLVTALKHATSTSVSCMLASMRVDTTSASDGTVADCSPLSATAPSGPVSFSQDTDSTAFASCTLGSPTTNTTTDPKSTRLTSSHKLITDAALLLNTNYGGDTSHNGSSDMTVVTALKPAT